MAETPEQDVFAERRIANIIAEEFAKVRMNDFGGSHSEEWLRGFGAGCIVGFEVFSKTRDLKQP